MLMQDEGKNQSEPTTNWQFQPGDTINPGATPAQAVAPNPAPVSPPQQPVAEAPALAQVATGMPQEPPVAQPMFHDTPEVSWTASEFMSHNKSFGWYVLLVLAALAGGVITFFVTQRSYVSAVLTMLAIGLLGVFAFMTRKPRTLTYAVDNAGVHIENKLYAYNELKAFTIQPEGPINAIVLIPMKRFMPPITVYYDPKDEDKIADTLSAHLSFDQEHNDPVDNFMRRIRF